MFSTGQIARRFKVSLRTLGHYEHLGLLAPQRVNGQRVYQEQDVMHLSFILEHKRLGLPLAQISAVLKDRDMKPAP